MGVSEKPGFLRNDVSKDARKILGNNLTKIK